MKREADFVGRDTNNEKRKTPRDGWYCADCINLVDLAPWDDVGRPAHLKRKCVLCGAERSGFRHVQFKDKAEG